MNPHQNPPIRQRQHPLLILAALAVILFCAIGTAAIMGWLPSSRGHTTNGQLSDADRAALAANLQPGQPGYVAGPVPSPAEAVAGNYPARPVQTQPLQPAYPAAPQAAYAPQAAVGYGGAQGATAYGNSAGGSTASGYAPAQVIDEPPVRVRETGHPTSRDTVRVAGSESSSNWCGNCGNVESVRTITTRARGSGIGAGAGAILGGLLGTQVGGGHGRQLATVAGAVGGAVVGNQVEGNMHADHSYEIRVRLDNGTLRTFHQHSAPQWRSGDRVRIVKGSLRAA